MNGKVVDGKAVASPPPSPPDTIDDQLRRGGGSGSGGSTLSKSDTIKLPDIAEAPYSDAGSEGSGDDALLTAEMKAAVKAAATAEKAASEAAAAATKAAEQAAEASAALARRESRHSGDVLPHSSRGTRSEPPEGKRRRRSRPAHSDAPSGRSHRSKSPHNWVEESEPPTGRSRRRSKSPHVSQSEPPDGGSRRKKSAHGGSEPPDGRSRRRSKSPHTPSEPSDGGSRREKSGRRRRSSSTAAAAAVATVDPKVDTLLSKAASAGLEVSADAAAAALEESEGHVGRAFNRLGGAQTATVEEMSVPRSKSLPDPRSTGLSRASQEPPESLSALPYASLSELPRSTVDVLVRQRSRMREREEERQRVEARREELRLRREEVGQELEEASHLEDYEVTAVKLQAAFRRVLAKHDLENKVEGKAEQARRMTETKLITAAGKMKAKSPIGNMAQRAAILGERHATLRHVPADCLLQASDGSVGVFLLPARSDVEVRRRLLAASVGARPPPRPPAHERAGGRRQELRPARPSMIFFGKLYAATIRLSDLVPPGGGAEQAAADRPAEHAALRGARRARGAGAQAAPRGLSAHARAR